MTVAHVDFETRSVVDLKKTGAYVYAQDASTDVWCLAWAIDNGPVELWTPDDHICPPELAAHIRSGGVMVAHNAAFERVIWRYIMTPRYGWPEPAVEQWRCTMAMAYAMALPGSLDNMLAALGTDQRKDMAGHRLMMTMAKPRRPKKGDPVGGTLWWDDEERRQRLYAYCKDDVVGERAGGDRLVRLRPSEQALWHLDQRINDRGVFVDKTLCLKAKAIVAHVTAKLDREMAVVTDWDVTACSNIGSLKTWVRARGVDTEALDKEALGELLSRDDLTPSVRRALELRQEAGKASVAKIDALLNGVGAGDRAQGLLQFHAANTGRWAGRRFQPQNIRRPSEDTDVDDAIRLILTYPAPRAAELLEMLYGPPLTVVSDCLRGMIRAAPGNTLYAADFANIEGRVLAWLAGEQWKLDAFRAYDAGTGPDLYKVGYGRSFGVLPEVVTKPQRQIGKVQELSLGYQGAHGAFVAMMANYGLKPADITAALRPMYSDDQWVALGRGFEARHGLSRDDWTAIKIVIGGFREAHPAVKQFWWDLDAAAMDAVASPGTVVSVRGMKFKVSGSFLWLQLRSGRALCYPYPHIAWKEMPWRDENDRPIRKQVVAYKAVSSYTRKWEVQYLYGGKIAADATQGTARDLMAEAMVRVENAGYPVVLSVHDEVVAEPKADFGSVEEFEALMVELPDWATGLPVAAEAWQNGRYRK